MDLLSISTFGWFDDSNLVGISTFGWYSAESDNITHELSIGCDIILQSSNICTVLLDMLAEYSLIFEPAPYAQHITDCFAQIDIISAKDVSIGLSQDIVCEADFSFESESSAFNQVGIYTEATLVTSTDCFAASLQSAFADIQVVSELSPISSYIVGVDVAANISSDINSISSLIVDSSVSLDLNTGKDVGLSLVLGLFGAADCVYESAALTSLTVGVAAENVILSDTACSTQLNIGIECSQDLTSEVSSFALLVKSLLADIQIVTDASCASLLGQTIASDMQLIGETAGVLALTQSIDAEFQLLSEIAAHPTHIFSVFTEFDLNTDLDVINSKICGVSADIHISSEATYDFGASYVTIDCSFANEFRGDALASLGVSIISSPLILEIGCGGSDVYVGNLGTIRIISTIMESTHTTNRVIEITYRGVRNARRNT